MIQNVETVWENVHVKMKSDSVCAKGAGVTEGMNDDTEKIETHVPNNQQDNQKFISKFNKQDISCTPVIKGFDYDTSENSPRHKSLMLSLEKWEKMRRRRGVIVNESEQQMCFSMFWTQTTDDIQGVYEDSDLSDSLFKEAIFIRTSLPQSD